MTFEEWWNENHEVHSRGFDIELVRIIQKFCKVSWEASQAQAKGAPSDTQQKIDKLTEHIANLEAEVAILNNAVSAQLTLRDQFAMAALGGILSHHGGTEGDFPMIARDAYQIADAMLEERKK